MLKDLARLAVQKGVMGPLFNYLGSAVNGMGSGGGSAPAGDGGFSTGGLDYPSGIAAGGSHATQISVTINQATGDSKTQAQTSTNLGREFEAAVNAVIVKNMRAGGSLARA